LALGCACGALASACIPLAVTHFLKMPPSFVGESQGVAFHPLRIDAHHDVVTTPCAACWKRLSGSTW